MKFCSNCNLENEDAAKFCKNCGSAISEEQPAKALGDSIKFEETPAKEAYPDQAPVYQQPPQQQPPQQGGYQQPPQQGGYQQPPQQGGYQQPPQQGGYQQPPQGGYQQPPQQVGYQPMMDPPKTRNFFLWLIVAIPLYIISGLGWVVYIAYVYVNFNDMRKLTQFTHPEWTHRESDPTLMLVLMIFFPIVPLYLKYQKLFDHLTLIHPEQTIKPINGGVYLAYSFGGMAIIFFMFFSALLSFDEGQLMLAFLLFFAWVIGFIYFDYQWQNALNTHVKMHGYY